MQRWTDDEDLTWRRFDCQFKTTKLENATTIWVKNSEYFNFDDNTQASFLNPLPNVFNNLSITDYIAQASGSAVPVHFEVAKNPSFPQVTVTVTGMRMDSGTCAALGATETQPSEDTYVYTYRTQRRSQNLTFKTTKPLAYHPAEGQNEQVTVRVEAADYTTQETRSHKFSHIGFVDGHYIPAGDYMTGGGYSNVVAGYCPKNGKRVLFGYCDDPDDLNNPVYAKLSFGGLSHLAPQKISFPWQPAVAASSWDQRFHLIHFNTSDDAGAINFTLRAPGYVESDPIEAGRMTGTDIHNWDEKAASFASGEFSTTAPSKIKGVYKVSFDKISKIDSGCIVLSAADAGTDGFELKVERTDTGANKVFYVEITVDAGSDLITGQFSDQTQVWDPATTQVRARNTALFEKYKGAANEYVWYMPIPNGSYNTIKLKAQNDGDIKIKKIVPKSYAGGFSGPSTP